MYLKLFFLVSTAFAVSKWFCLLPSLVSAPWPEPKQPGQQRGCSAVQRESAGVWEESGCHSTRKLEWRWWRGGGRWWWGGRREQIRVLAFCDKKNSMWPPLERKKMSVDQDFFFFPPIIVCLNFTVVFLKAVTIFFLFFGCM